MFQEQKGVCSQNIVAQGNEIREKAGGKQSPGQVGSRVPWLNRL